LHQADVGHHHGPLEDTANKPYANRALLWIQADETDAAVDRAHELDAETVKQPHLKMLSSKSYGSALGVVAWAKLQTAS
jgi:hypothetical protein